MDVGGRTVSSFFHLGGYFADKRISPKVPLKEADSYDRQLRAIFYEMPASVIFFLIQHELLGHGGRAREYNLKPRYGIFFDWPEGGAYTTLRKSPKTFEQLTLISGAGIESNQVIAHRFLLDSFSSNGGNPLSVFPFLLSKLDFSSYFLLTPNPKNKPNTFQKKYEEGNDIVFWLVANQSRRIKGSVKEVWDQNYKVIVDDPILIRYYQLVREAAIWNMIDPTIITSLISYFRDWLSSGKSIQVEVFSHKNIKLGLTTRATLAENCVNRYLDLFLGIERIITNLYIRDIRNHSSTRYGWGFQSAITISKNLNTEFVLDYWKDENRSTLHNVSFGISFKHRLGLGGFILAGRKDKGFLMGLPFNKGFYLQLGINFNILAW